MNAILLLNVTESWEKWAQSIVSVGHGALLSFSRAQGGGGQSEFAAAFDTGFKIINICWREKTPAPRG
jgi:hypothetical protein